MLLSFFFKSRERNKIPKKRESVWNDDMPMYSIFVCLVMQKGMDESTIIHVWSGSHLLTVHPIQPTHNSMVREIVDCSLFLVSLKRLSMVFGKPTREKAILEPIFPRWRNSWTSYVRRITIGLIEDSGIIFIVRYNTFTRLLISPV